MPTLLQNNSAGKLVTLSSRLSAIAESLPEKSVVCDVGSDHGTLPLYLLTSGKCNEAIVTDLNEKPLDRAKRNLCEYGVESRAKFILTDGIEEVLQLNPDAFVIAGMGGETIVGILQRGLCKIRFGTHFVLQPMTKTATLRRFLYESGFSVSQEKLVYENHKFFVILCATYDGISRPKDVDFFEFGEFLPKLRNKVAKSYFSALSLSLQGVIDGKRKAGLCCEDENNRMCLITKILDDMEDVDENQRD